MKEDITELFYIVDEFAKIYLSYEKAKLLPSTRLRNRDGNLTLSELLTIYISYSESPCKNFKHYYTRYISIFYRKEFPRLISYERFVEWIPRLLLPLSIFLHCLYGKETGTYIIDSTKIAVCHTKRIKNNKVFSGLAKIGKSTMGWFFGFKLHIIINDTGELMAVRITQGNVDDRAPLMSMSENLIGTLLADRGYIDQKKFVLLYRKGLKIIVGIKKTMKNKLMIFHEKILYRKRFLVETVFGYLKQRMDLEHTRHRSPINAFTHIIATLVAYSLKPNKPKINYIHNMA